MFKATFNLIHSELDNWENGCDFGSSTTRYIDELSFQSETLEQLLKDICKHFNVKTDSLLLNSCDEIGRIDVQTYTRSPNTVKCMYARNKEKFKAGGIDLYLNNISGNITQTLIIDLEGVNHA